MTRLGDVLVDVKPGFATGDNLDDGVFQFRMHNFTREGALDLTKRRRVGATARQLELQSVAPGDVLFNATNSPELVGKSALIGRLDEPAVFSNHFMRLRTDLAQLDPGYLAHFLRFQFHRGVFRAMAKAWVNQATIGRDRLEGLEIPLPLVDEQRRIAAILDQADAIRAKRSKALSHLDALPQAMLSSLLNEAHPTLPLGQVANFIRGVTFKPADKKEAGEGTVAVMRTKNVQRHLDRSDEIHIAETLVRRREQYLQPGDTLISSANSWNLVGKACLVPDALAPAVIGGFVTALRSSGLIDPFYLFNWFVSPKIQALARSFSSQTTSIANLNLKRCEGLDVPVPPKSRQLEFARQFAAVTAQRDLAVAELATQDDFFMSLQVRAFAGAFG